MKVLITGGAGYIGSHTVHLLNSLNYQIVVIDNLSTGFRDAIPANVKFYNVDLADTEKVEEVFKNEKITSVIHFAASIRVDESVTNPQKYYSNNFLNTFNLVRTCLKYKVSEFVFSSTAAVYGDATTDQVSEISPLQPISPYGTSKSFSEKIIQDLAGTASGFNFVILRYFNVAGASLKFPIGQKSPSATHLIKVCSEVATGKRSHIEVYGNDYPTPDGTCIRDYIHIDDLAFAHKLALDYLKNEKKSHIFNCGYEKGFSVNDVIKTFEKVSKTKFKVLNSKRREGDSARIVASAKQIKTVLNWKPQYDDLEIICKSSFEWEKKVF
jgi:UDP-glucose 4-epimerase